MAFETPVIDSGVGANENPLAGSWAQMLTTLDPLKRASNALASSTGTGLDGSYRPGTTYAADCEFYVRFVALPPASEGGWLYLRLQGGGGSGTGFNGYAFNFGNDGSGFAISNAYSMTNGSASSLGSASGLPSTWTIGDYVGFRCLGTSIEQWCRPVSTGVWVQGAAVTDATYSAGGTVALGIVGSSLTVDNFGGGNVGVITRNIDMRL